MTMKKQLTMVVVLNEWRARILNFFLIIVALTAAVMTGININDAISKSGQTE